MNYISSGFFRDLGIKGDWPTVSGSIISFDTYEHRIGRDVNGDGDTNDRVVAYHDIVTNSAEPAAVGNISSMVNGSIIAFDTLERWVGDLNGDGDVHDSVIRYVVLPLQKGGIPALMDLIESSSADGAIDSEGIARASRAMAEQAQAMLDRGNAEGARNILKAFIALVEAQAGKRITEEASDALLVAAQEVLVSL